MGSGLKSGQVRNASEVPSVERLAAALDADEDELLVLERPDVFGKLARLDDAMLDRVMAQVARLERKVN